MSLPCGYKSNTETVAQYRKRCGPRPLGMIGKVHEGDDKLELIKLYNYAMKLVPGSQEQKNVIKVINKKRKEMGLDKIKESKGFFTRGKSPEKKGKNLLRVMKSDLEKKLKGVPHSLSPDSSGTRIII